MMLNWLELPTLFWRILQRFQISLVKFVTFLRDQCVDEIDHSQMNQEDKNTDDINVLQGQLLSIKQGKAYEKVFKYPSRREINELESKTSAFQLWARS